MTDSVHAAVIVVRGQVGHCRCRRTRRRDHLPVHWCRHLRQSRRHLDDGTVLIVRPFWFFSLPAGATLAIGSYLVNNTCPKGAMSFSAKYTYPHLKVTQLTFQNISSTLL